MKKLIASIAVAAALFSAAPQAQAGNHWAVGLNYGFNDAHKFGFGGRAGGDFFMPKLYTGFNFDYFLGTSTNVGTSSASANVWIANLDAGWEFDVAQNIKVIPVLGLGLGGISGSVSGGSINASGSSTKFLISPGVYGLYDLGDFNVGANLKFNILGSGADALVFGVNFGMDF